MLSGDVLEDVGCAACILAAAEQVIAAGLAKLRRHHALGDDKPIAVQHLLLQARELGAVDRTLVRQHHVCGSTDVGNFGGRPERLAQPVEVVLRASAHIDRVLRVHRLGRGRRGRRRLLLRLHRARHGANGPGRSLPKSCAARHRVAPPASPAATLRELPIGGQNADLGGVFVTSFGEGVHHVAPAFPEIS
jgi:hypothetical protein